MKKGIVILGSSRSNGNTRKAITELDPEGKMEVVDLSELDISFYDYNHKNQNDDFIKVMEKVLEHEVIVFATPVYWYTMSAQMKVFFDRLTDCVTIKKEMGRALEGKKTFLLVSYSNNELDNFEYPFEGTSRYFKMEYKGAFYHYGGTKEELLAKNSELPAFKARIDEALEVNA